MPRNKELSSTDERLKRTKLAREQLRLEQERAEWAKACRPKYPGKSDWELRRQDYYKEQLYELNNARYQILLCELRSLIVAQKKRKRAAESRAQAHEASLENEEVAAKA